LLCIRSTR